MLSILKRRERRARREADALYSAVARAARHPAFFTRLGVPDSVEGRFEVLVLHLVPLVRRLSHGADADAELARDVVESFVAELDHSLRDLGVGDMKVPKSVQGLFNAYGGRLASYTLAAGERDALAGAVARNVYGSDAPDEAARAIADWLAETSARFAGADLAILRQGLLPYADPA